MSKLLITEYNNVRIDLPLDHTYAVTKAIITKLLPAGPTGPDEPMSLRSMATTFSTATLYWSIPRVAYTPETYTVEYGTNALNLNERSATVSGVSGVNDYSVELTGLQHATLYYYRVQSTNSIGTRSSGLSSVQIRNASKQQKVILNLSFLHQLV